MIRAADKVFIDLPNTNRLSWLLSEHTEVLFVSILRKSVCRYQNKTFTWISPLSPSLGCCSPSITHILSYHRGNTSSIKQEAALQCKCPEKNSIPFLKDFKFNPSWCHCSGRNSAQRPVHVVTECHITILPCWHWYIKSPCISSLAVFCLKAYQH